MQTPSQPEATQAPIPPRSITISGPDGKSQTLTIPKTATEVRQLFARRAELSDQLINVSSRRSELAAEIRSETDASTRAGLDDRLRVLDQRILQLESDLASTGRQVSAAPADLLALAQIENRSGSGSDFEEGLMIGGVSVFLLLSIAFFFARRRWKRSAKAVPAQLGVESAQRLERLEQGMEAIAIEIERVSEGQRFVTKLLSESQAPLVKSPR